MASTEFVLNYSPGKLEEFLTKAQKAGAPDKLTTDFPKSLGFGSSHARGFPAVLKYAGLLDASGKPTDAYTKGLRGGTAGRKLVGAAIKQGYKALFDTYPDADSHDDVDLRTLVKSLSSGLDDDKATLVVRTFKALCKFGEFDASAAEPDEDADDDDAEDDGGQDETAKKQRRRKGNGGSSTGVNVTVNIALSVDATSDPAVYDAFFAAMAKHIGGLVDGS